MCVCSFITMNFLLLHDNITANRTALNSTYLLPQSFWGSGVWARLSWVLCLGSHKAAHTRVGQGIASNLL